MWPVRGTKRGVPTPARRDVSPAQSIGDGLSWMRELLRATR